MSQYETLLVAKDEQNPAVAILTLNRPEAMNSFNMTMFRELQSAYKALDSDLSVRVIVVTGAGRAFCAGADISEGFGSSGFMDGPSMHGDIQRDTGGELNLDVFGLDTPVIGAVNGAAVGVGATMLLPMDMRICSEKSKFGFPFARRGIVFDGAASFFLPRLVGHAKASEWILRGEIILADEMYRAGFVSEVHPPENVLPRALELARDIAVHCAPTSVTRNKQLLRASMFGHGALEEAAMSAHLRESEFLNQSFYAEDAKEGVAAFLEKRAPKFKERQS